MDTSQGRGANVIPLHPRGDARGPAPERAPASSFVRIVERQLTTCRRYGAGLAVLVIRLDGLAAVRQHHGREAQERVLELATQRLKSRLRGTDAFTRTATDTFGVALFRVGSEVVASIEARLFDELSSPYKVGDVSVEVMAVTGAAVFPRAGLTAGELVLGAQQSMEDKGG